jgi:uncharacterized repeat protein (TIGR03837 family)
VNTANLWDIFCKVIDNYGDVGVCWRLAVGLAARGERVRLWVDDASALRWMAPHGADNVEVRAWTRALDMRTVVTGDILVEAFGCEIAPEYLAAYAEKIRARGAKGPWINLEYLSAEGFVERSHGLPSPVMSGPGAGLSKHFFYPGFTAATGGLLREPDLMVRQARFDRTAWLTRQGIEYQGKRLVSLFCYEPPALDQLLNLLAEDDQPTRLLVTAGRATLAVQAYIKNQIELKPGWNKHQKLSFSFIQPLTQSNFDHLLWACDLNFVRGEDSLVRALWANKPLVWHVYEQHDDARHAKLAAFLDWLKAPPSLRRFHEVWNGVTQVNLPSLALAEWQATVTAARTEQLQSDDLATRLLSFVSKNH